MFTFSITLLQGPCDSLKDPNYRIPRFSLFCLTLLWVFVGTGYTLQSVTSSTCPLLPLRYTEIPSWNLALQTPLSPSTFFNKQYCQYIQKHVRRRSLLLPALLDFIQLLYWRVVEPTTHLQVVRVLQMERRVEWGQDGNTIQSRSQTQSCQYYKCNWKHLKVSLMLLDIWKNN